MINIEQEILEIKQRNKQVEADKAWEKSWTRRICITVMTYIVAAVWLILINDSIPLLKALVPSIGYILSTLSIKSIKKYWIANLK